MIRNDQEMSNKNAGEKIPRRSVLRKMGFASGVTLLGGMVVTGSSAAHEQGPIDGRMARFEEPPAAGEQFDLLYNEGGFADNSDIRSCISGGVNEWITDKAGGYADDRSDVNGNALLLLRDTRDFEEGDTLEVARVGGECEPDNDCCNCLPLRSHDCVRSIRQ